MHPLKKKIPRKDSNPVHINLGFGCFTAEELLYYYPRPYFANTSNPEKWNGALHKSRE